LKFGQALEGAWDSLALWNPSLCFSSWLGTRTH
jgi:hypothetical protein